MAIPFRTRKQERLVIKRRAFELMDQGLTNTQIKERFGVSATTVTVWSKERKKDSPHAKTKSPTH